MKILIVSQCFWPEQFRINDIAQKMVDNGCEVEVVTGQPNYGSGELFPGYKNRFVDQLFGETILVHRCPIVPRKKGLFHLALNYLSFMMNGRRAVKHCSFRPDIVFSFQTSPVFQLAPAVFAKRRFGVPLIAYCCDMWPESVKVSGVSNQLVLGIASAFSKRLYNQCDHIINVCDFVMKYNHEKNGYPLDKMSVILQHSEDLFADALPQKPTDSFSDFLYAGNIGKAQNLKNIILAFGRLQNPHIRLHVVGNGSEWENCVDIAQKLGVKDKTVFFYGRVPLNEMPHFFKKCDCCVISLSSETLVGNLVPSRFASFLSSGKPIVGIISGDTANLIRTNSVGFTANPNDVADITLCFERATASKNKWKQMGENSRKLYENSFSEGQFLARLLGTFDSLKQENSRS